MRITRMTAVGIVARHCLKALHMTWSQAAMAEAGHAKNREREITAQMALK